MTDRNIIVRDMIVHLYMQRSDIPNNQGLEDVLNKYRRFRGENQSAFDYLEELAVDFVNPEAVAELDRMTDEFCQWMSRLPDY